MTAEEKIRGRQVGVIGMARSGMAAAMLAQRHGAIVFVSDSAPEDKLKEQVRKLSDAGISCETGSHSERLLACDYLVLSPGVPLTTDILRSATEKGIPCFSELEFASWLCPGRIVAITGSNGKTTTVTLLGEMLSAGGLDTHVCGNIGRPFADVVDNMSGSSVAVVEVSTFQLETIADFRPHVGVILNLTPDHLDRHCTFENYKKTKYRIADNQTSADHFILNRDDLETMSDNPDSKATRLFFSVGSRNGVSSFVESDTLYVQVTDDPVEIIKTGEIGIPGPHNLQNASAAALVATLLDVPAATIADVLRNFPGVEHRLETVGMVAGVRFINDSKATNVDSVCFALKSVPEPTYLICGGRDKGSSYRPIIESGRERIKGLIVIGEAREKIFDELGKSFSVQFADTLEDAVRMAFDLAIPGEVVLLSPACASFDMFGNFEERGRTFKRAVHTLRNNSSKNETVSG